MYDSLIENLSNQYNYQITRKQAENLYVNNCLTVTDLVSDAGNHNTYNLADLREKLGY